MSARELTTLLAGLMVAGVLVWSVTAWIYTSPATLISGTLVGLVSGGILLWGLGWLMEARPAQRPGTRRPRSAT